MSKANISIVIIAAVAENGVIGVDGDMPWRISSDFAHFKRTTMGKPMIMGRKQFETLGKPLPGRVNIVVSRQVGYQPEGVIVIKNFEAAIEHAKTIARADQQHEIMIIGGGEIYKLGMGNADRLIISHVEKTIAERAGCQYVYFPKILPEEWGEGENWTVTPSERDEAVYSIKVYHRLIPHIH